MTRTTVFCLLFLQCTSILVCVRYFWSVQTPIKAKASDAREVSLVADWESWNERSASTLRKKRHIEPSEFLGSGYIPEFYDNLSLIELQMLYHGNMIATQHKCKNISRFGKQGDGGYYMCLDKDHEPEKSKCLVYSFGIRNEWSFDDSVNAAYNCEVHSFDPSMGMEDHVHKEPNMFFHNLGVWGSNIRFRNMWELRDLATIRKMLGHENRTIDYLKVDVEGAEWPLITHILQSGVHKYIKQMVLELHTPRITRDAFPMVETDYAEIHNSLVQLQAVGFRKYMEPHSNGCCRRFVELTPATVAGKQLCCYEAFYVNENYTT